MEVNCRLRRDLEAMRPKSVVSALFEGLRHCLAMRTHNQMSVRLHKRKMFLIRRQIVNNEVVFLIGNAVVIAMY